jgi:hypothetical protein
MSSFDDYCSAAETPYVPFCQGCKKNMKVSDNTVSSAELFVCCDNGTMVEFKSGNDSFQNGYCLDCCKTVGHCSKTVGHCSREDLNDFS